MNKMFILTTIFSVGLSVVLANPVPQNSGVNQGSRFTNLGPGFLNIGIPPVFNNPSKELLRNAFNNLNSGLIGAGIPAESSSNPSAPQIDVVQPVPTPTEAGTTIVNAGNVPLAIPDAPSQISTAVTDNVPRPTPQVEVAQPAAGIPSNPGMGNETVENVNPVVQSVVNLTASLIDSVIPVISTSLAGVAPSLAVPQTQSAESAMQPIAPPPKQEFGTETTGNAIPVGQSVVNPSPNELVGFINPIDHYSLLNKHFKLIQNLLNSAATGAGAGIFNVNPDGALATSDVGSSSTSGGGSSQGTSTPIANEIVQAGETTGNVNSGNSFSASGQPVKAVAPIKDSKPLLPASNQGAGIGSGAGTVNANAGGLSISSVAVSNASDGASSQGVGTATVTKNAQTGVISGGTTGTGNSNGK